MALWQYTFLIVPSASVQKIGNNANELVEDGLFDDSVLWMMNKNNLNLFNKIKSFLPQITSWHKDLTLYGDLESTCIKIMSDANVVLSVVARIDFRNNYDEVLFLLIEFINNNNLLFLDENFKVVPSDIRAIKKIISSSKQFFLYEELLRNQHL